MELCIHLFYWTETLSLNWCPKNDYIESVDFCPYIKTFNSFLLKLFYFFSGWRLSSTEKLNLGEGRAKPWNPNPNPNPKLKSDYKYVEKKNSRVACWLKQTLNIFHVQRCLFKASILICLSNINTKKSCRKLIATFRTKINWEFSHSFFFSFLLSRMSGRNWSFWQLGVVSNISWTGI